MKQMRQLGMGIIGGLCLLSSIAVRAQENLPAATAVAFSPDHTLVAMAQPARPGHILLWVPGQTKPKFSLSSYGDIGQIRFSPDSHWLAFNQIYSPGNGVNASQVSIANSQTGQIVKQFAQALAFDFSPDRQSVAILLAGGILLHHLSSNQSQAWIDLPTPAWQVVYHPQGTHVALISKTFMRQRQEFVVQLLDLKTRKIVQISPPLGDVFYHAAFSPDGKHLLTGHNMGLVRVWDTFTLNEQGSVSTGLKGYVQPVWAGDGKTLLVGSSASRTVLLMDPKSHNVQKQIRFSDCAFPLLTSRFVDEVVTPEVQPAQFALSTTQDMVVTGCDHGTLFDIQADERRSLF